MHHEASQHDENSFVTLTYADQHLPMDGSLSVRAVQLFFKRLRKSLAGRPVRYYACGEYGETNGRPHYHVILFGYQFPDLVAWRRSPTGHYLYRSEKLEKLWPFGHSEVGHVTHQSAGYCARYTLKKLTGEPAAAHYSRPHPLTGVVSNVIPEFGLMSRRPGIGSSWFDQFHSDAFPSDFVVIDGTKRPVPRFYKNKLEDLAALEITRLRKNGSRARSANNTDQRLDTREKLQTLRQAKLVRDLGNANDP
jgi:hypothetical protein